MPSRYLNSDEIRDEIERNSREPFQGALADLLAAQPDTEALAAWALKSPDRWAQAVAIFGRLSGYHERAELIVDDLRKLRTMSDAELLAAAEQLDQMDVPAALAHNVEDAEYTERTPEGPETPKQGD